MLTNRKAQGFTIVELLIVVVIVAILASITLVAFNGVQNRAQNSRILGAVTSWEKILKLYKVQKGALPSSDYNCLSSASTDFPAGSVLAAGECMHGYPGSPSFSAVHSAALSADLKSVLTAVVVIPAGTLPPISDTVSSTAIYSQGIRYNNLTLQYYVIGKNGDCGKGSALASQAGDQLTFCTLDLSA
jgi:prepilin-type N-terminal cleavage/methylation domain-containing protein